MEVASLATGSDESSRHKLSVRGRLALSLCVIAMSWDQISRARAIDKDLTLRAPFVLIVRVIPDGFYQPRYTEVMMFYTELDTIVVGRKLYEIGFYKTEKHSSDGVTVQGRGLGIVCRVAFDATSLDPGTGEIRSAEGRSSRANRAVEPDICA